MIYYCDWFENKYILFNVRSKSLHGTDGMRMSRTKMERSTTHLIKEIRDSVKNVNGV